MSPRQIRRTNEPGAGDDLLRRLQKMLYEFHALGRYEEARPHILWLMEIAEAESRSAADATQPFNA